MFCQFRSCFWAVWQQLASSLARPTGTRTGDETYAPYHSRQPKDIAIYSAASHHSQIKARNHGHEWRAKVNPLLSVLSTMYQQNYTLVS
jgi:hypothetical protein